VTKNGSVALLRANRSWGVECRQLRSRVSD